jgi:FlaA1/EpsC-like NDP-sugar epimerase
MGEPVKIMDLAQNMIKLSGHEPGVDIEIQIVGRRPGEKLHEELFGYGERPVPTEAERILKAERPTLDPDWVETVFEQVERLVAEGDEAYLVQRIAEVARESVGVPVETSRDRSHV